MFFLTQANIFFDAFGQEGKNMLTYNKDTRTVLDDSINFWHEKKVKSVSQWRVSKMTHSVM